MISRRHKAGWANPAAGVSGMPYLPRMGGSSSGQGAADRQDRRAALRRRVRGLGLIRELLKTATLGSQDLALLPGDD